MACCATQASRDKLWYFNRGCRGKFPLRSRYFEDCEPEELGDASMPFQFFRIPVRGDPSTVEELNQFLRSHRILKVDKEWVERGANSFWAFCIDYWDGAASPGKGVSSESRIRIDYKEQLTPEQFEVFAKLRDWRKQVAQAEAVPVYTVFTNEQLAQMIQKRTVDRAGIESVAGVGDARITKYGDRLLAVLQSCFVTPTEPQP